MKKPPQFRTIQQSTSRRFKIPKDDSIKHLYDYKWIKYSKIFLSVNKYCYACGKSSEHTDHIKPARFFPEEFKNLYNHLPLCKSCHSYVTNHFDVCRGRLNDKLKWLEDMRKETNTNIKVKVLEKYPD